MKMNLSLAKAFHFGSSFLGSFLVLASVSQAAFAEEINSSSSITNLSSPVVHTSGLESAANSADSLSQISKYGSEEARSSQVTSVSQLSDVQPTDWAFQALQSLVERYGCIAGYPNRTYRGNRPLTRYEFAAGLNACMDRVNELIASATADLVKKEDLAAIKKLQEEFATELATLRGRVDSLEARTKTLEAQQFSTTTKLNGEVIFSLVKQGGNNPSPVRGFQFNTPVASNTTFNSRATLNLLTSFTGKDTLITSLQASNFGQTRGNIFNQQLLLGPALSSATSNNSVALFYLGYRFPILKDKGTIYATAVGGELSDFTDTLNPYFESEGQGSLSAFGTRNPIYRQVNSLFGTQSSGAGLGFNYEFNKNFEFSIGYLAPNLSAANPNTQDRNFFGNPGGGLFGGDYAAIAQLTVKPVKTLGLGFTYVRSYTADPFFGGISLSGGTGTTRGRSPFLGGPVTTNSGGFEFSWKAHPRIAIGGWAGATFAETQGNTGTFGNDGFIRVSGAGNTATILNYALTLAFPDLGAKGNLGGIIFGSQPTVISSSVSNNTDPTLNYHIEAFYRIKINDFISVTPGGFVIVNPEGVSGNDPIYATTVRTTFSF